MNNEISDMIRNGECPCDICKHRKISSMFEPCYSCSNDEHFRKFIEETDFEFPTFRTDLQLRTR